MNMGRNIFTYGLEIIRKLFNYLKAPEKRNTKIIGVLFVLLIISSNCSPTTPSAPHIPTPASTNTEFPSYTPEPTATSVYVDPVVDENQIIIITFIFYNGVVRQVESDEYAVIKNVSSIPVNLSGWRLNAGSEGQDFYFPNFTIYPGVNCRVYTNQIHNEGCRFSVGNHQAIWKNSGDCGYLFDADGKLEDSYCY